MNNLKQTLEKTLKTEPLFCDSESGELNYIKIKDSADKIDERLIALLADHQDLKEQFFTKIRDVYVFNIKDFKFFLDESRVDNSYTKYANRIGLADNSGLLENRSEVVLDFPFKDCLLQGGQRVEEGTDTYFEYSKTAEKYEQKTAKRKEIFFNQALARDEIDRLLDRKALIHWRRFAADGTKDGEPVTEIKRDKTGLIQENLIIKGNNLLALHSLKYEFAGKVKLIYIDPPYNTEGDADTFVYNNNFKHSTWLTFMKNRLEIAREFLREDGFIAIAIDHYELFYLGVLADEIFGRENRLGVITVVHKPEGRQFAKGVNTTNEFMFLYSKCKKYISLHSVPIDDEKKAEFNEKDEYGNFRWIDYIRLGGGDANLRKNNPDNWYPVYISSNLSEISLIKKESWHEIFPVTDKGIERTWNNSKNKFLEDINNKNVKVVQHNHGLKILRKLRANQMIKTHWDKPRYSATKYGTQLLTKIIGENTFSYPKSLYTVLDTLKITTNKDDIIMDFFAGSGTTGHAVVELNKDEKTSRRFILIEQMGYVNSVIVPRINEVMKINKSNQDFIYCELAKWNEQAKEEIQNAQDLPALVTLFDTLYEKYFLNYNIKIKEFKENIINEQQFKHLTLNEHKKMFLAMLDLNQMYVNESEMADKRYGIKPEDQKLTKDFYSKK